MDPHLRRRVRRNPSFIGTDEFTALID